MSEIPAVEVPAERSRLWRGPETPIAFTGRAGAFLSLLMKGALLQILTLGFYRFWLITKLRRHLWSNTRIGNEPLEYTGTAKEILIGFLVALAILTPIYVGYAFLGVLLEERQAFASVGLFVVLYALGQFAAYRGQRYRVNRTTYRGVRFWMDGSGWAYAGLALLWTAVTILTLGFAYPWRNAALQRYQARHLHFGSLRGRFLASGGDLFRVIWAPWLLVVLTPIVGAIVLGRSGAFWTLGATLVMWLVAAPVLMARTMRWRVGATRLGDVSLRSNLDTGNVVLLTLGWLLSMILWIAVFTAATVAFFAHVQGAMTALNLGAVDGSVVQILALAGVAYLVFVLGFMVMHRFFMGRGLWSLVASTTVVLDIEALDGVVAAGSAASSLDQGFADVLDVGAF